MTGNNVNWTDPDFFAQFDGSTQYHDVEMGEPEHFAMPELTTSQLGKRSSFYTSSHCLPLLCETLCRYLSRSMNCIVFDLFICTCF